MYVSLAVEYAHVNLCLCLIGAVGLVMRRKAMHVARDQSCNKYELLPMSRHPIYSQVCRQLFEAFYSFVMAHYPPCYPLAAGINDVVPRKNITLGRESLM